MAHGHGELQLDKFEPFPKNPAISKVFREIGLADELGSGMRNTHKYTALYSGGVPSFDEGDVFTVSIPLKSIATAKAGPEDPQDDTQSIQTVMLSLSEDERTKMKPILSYLEENDFINSSIARELTSKSPTTIKRYLGRLCEVGLLKQYRVGRGSYYERLINIETSNEPIMCNLKEQKLL